MQTNNLKQNQNQNHDFNLDFNTDIDKITFDNINLFNKGILYIYKSEFSDESKIEKYNLLVEKIVIFINKEKNRLIKKFNNEIKFYNINLKTNQELKDNLNKALSRKRQDIVKEYNKIKFPDSLINLNNELKIILANKENFLDGLEELKEKINSTINKKIKKNNELDKLIFNLNLLKKKKLMIYY